MRFFRMEEKKMVLHQIIGRLKARARFNDTDISGFV